jgi:homoserine kinase
MALAFDKQIKAFAKKANMSVEKTIRGTSIKLFSAVILASPVDTGRFRANWQVGGESPETGIKNDNDKSGNKTINEVVAHINGERINLEFTLANNLPYAYKLEYGYSQQAPQGFIRVNVARFQRILDEQARVNR